MVNKTALIGSIASLGIVFTIASGEATAQKSHQTHSSTTVQSNQFQRIDQPLSSKLAVTLGGLGLIGLEIWWFLLSKPKSQKAVTTGRNIQEVTVTVDGGYEPSRIVVQAGQLVRLKFERKDPSSCLEKVVIPDFHIAVNLPLNQVTTVEFTPNQVGTYLFTCGMNMFRGAIAVQNAETASPEMEISSSLVNPN
jgi:plastocyanin domain-containing protein